jgi:hypothetical protein
MSLHGKVWAMFLYHYVANLYDALSKVGRLTGNEGVWAIRVLQVMYYWELRAGGHLRPFPFLLFPLVRCSSIFLSRVGK